MQASTADYAPPSYTSFPTLTSTVQTMRSIGWASSGTTFFWPEVHETVLNQRVLDLLNELKKLKDNWDEEGAPAPSPRAIRHAEVLVNQLNRAGQKVFHIAPGPRGEIMVDLRENGKSVEILFYPEKMRYVQFPAAGEPEQGEFHPDLLPKLLKWLNG
ncbi:MAG: hypothetical protein ACK4Q5_16635 [Saprospiraceae bacterium]